jgi:hypothetical protein
MSRRSMRSRCEASRRALCRLPLITVLCIAAWPTLASSTSLEEARAKLETGRIEDAARLAETALRRSPRDPHAHILVGTILLVRGKNGEATKSFEFALALDPDVREEVGRAHLAAVRHFVAAANADAAEAALEGAAEHVSELRDEGVATLYADALARYRGGDAASGELLARWRSRFPDYSPHAEEDLFTLAVYHEAEGRRPEAAQLYRRCAAEYPEGELGRRAAELLRPQRVALDLWRAVECGQKLFVGLRSVVRGYDATQVELSFAWVSADRSRAPVGTLHLLSESSMETEEGESLSLLADETGRRRAGRQLDLESDREHRVVLQFPPLPRDWERATLVLANDSCGSRKSGGDYELRFPEVLLATSSETPAPGASGEAVPSEIAVLHVHDYFLAAGLCSGSLVFTAQGISYRSDGHAFELSCEDVLRVTEGRKDILIDPGGRFGQIGIVPTLMVEGRELAKKGKVKTVTRHFLASDGMPPALLLAKNLCRSGGREAGTAR